MNTLSFSLEWIILVTDNFIASRNFYKDILGLEIVREATDEEFCQFKLQNCFLAMYGRKEMQTLVGDAINHNGGGAIYTFAESEDIDADVASLKRRGVTFIKDPTTQPWGQRTAYFTDPDGHIWELQQWVNKNPEFNK